MNLDAATLELGDYQNKIQQGNEWGTTSISNLISRSLAAVSDLAVVAVTVIVLLTVDIKLGFFALLATLPLYYIEQKFNRKLFRTRYLNTEASRLIGNRKRLFYSQYTLTELNMFNSASKFSDEAMQCLREFDDEVINIQRKKKSAQIFFRVYSTIFSIAAVILVLQKGLNGSILLGTMLFAFSAYNSFYSSMSNFFSDLAIAQDASRYALIWFDIFDTKPMIASKKNALRPNFTKPPTVEFKNVSFKYSDGEEDVLRDINITLKSGDKVAIVGLSGAGKTTLIKLLSRVYDPTDGEILVDGINLKDIDIECWHEYLGVMFQNYGQYNVTVEESIAVGKNGKMVDSKKVRWAAEMSGAKIFVEALKEGFKQLLWKGFKEGVELSKGEHQRIAIARIFYRDALISILDEPTSSVDALTADMIFKNLEEKMENKTVVLISHNFSTVKESSNIIVLESGTILEQGNHNELYSSNGRYTELYDMQANAFEKKS